MYCEFNVGKNRGENPAGCINYIDSEPGSCGLCKLPSRFLCIVDLEKHLPTISHSARKTFARCRQAYYFNYVCGISPKRTESSTPIKLGSIWSMFVNSRYNDGIVPRLQKTSSKDMPFVGKKFKSVFWDICASYELDEYDSAKIYAVCKAFMTLKMSIDLNGFEAFEKEFHIVTESAIIRGFIDLSYYDHFVECKHTKNPEFYHTIHNITSQVATYFLSNPEYEYCLIQAVKTPSLRPNIKKLSSESPDKYLERCYDAIISRPSEYFPGYNRESKTFGKKFYRAEFPLKQIEKDYSDINRDIRRAAAEEAFYQNWDACYCPGPCDFLPVCKNGVASEELFDRKKKPGTEQEKPAPGSVEIDDVDDIDDIDYPELNEDDVPF